ncbi:hypothetical protein MnTg02_01894 [bacterium MnTg02]|nr:hypothetical protein MnTg02_01894 [bacterium MnTg02]
MQELVDIITSKLGIKSELAEKAIGIILKMLKSEGPSDKVDELLTALPGAEDLISKVSNGGARSGGGLVGLISGALGGSGALMETLSELQSEGLDIDQSKSIGLEVLAFAKEKASEDLVKEIADSIPGLSQFV